MNYIEFVKAIKNRVENSYVITGDDIFLLKQVEDKVTKALNITLSEFDKIIFDQENFEIGKFENAVLMLPFSADKKLVIVKNLNKLGEGDKKKISSALNQAKSACVLFFANPEGEMFAFLKDSTKLDCSRLSPALCMKFVDDKVKDAGFVIDDDAKNQLVNLCLNNLGKIISELEKLFTYCMDEKVIDLKAVNVSVKSDLEYQIYEIADLLQNKNLDRALEIISDMLTKKEEPTAILSMLTASFRRTYFCKISPHDDLSLASKLGVKEYAVKIARRNISKVTAPQLKLINEMLLEVDYSIKSGAMPQDLALYFAVTKIYAIINKM